MGDGAEGYGEYSIRPRLAAAAASSFMYMFLRAISHRSTCPTDMRLYVNIKTTGMGPIHYYTLPTQIPEAAPSMLPYAWE